MEEQRLVDVIHTSTFNRDVKNIKTIKDFFKDMIKGDLSNLKMEVVNEQKEVLEWIIANPDYNYINLYEMKYTNEELYEYLQVYYERVLFLIKKYKNKDYIVKPEEDFK